MRKFWEWKNQTETQERTLRLNGVIAEESWFDDDITPQIFKDELNSGSGDITVWINSPGGDCIAAAQIYNMLMDYKGKVTVKIDGLAASAASVIAMAGDKVLISPVGMLMIHNPATIAAGDSAEMAKAIAMLDEVKESIINAYEIKTNMSRAKLSRLMDEETWMDARSAVDMGFADEIIQRGGDDDNNSEAVSAQNSVTFSRKAAEKSLTNKVAAKYSIPAKDEKAGRTTAELNARLDILKETF